MPMACVSPDLVLTHPGRLTDRQISKLRDGEGKFLRQIGRQMEGTANAHRVAILEGGMGMIPFGSTGRLELAERRWVPPAEPPSVGKAVLWLGFAMLAAAILLAAKWAWWDAG